MKINITICFFIFSCFIFSQNQGQIAYKGTLNLNNLKSFDDNISAEKKKIMDDFYKQNSSVFFTLKIKNKESIFTQNKKLEVKEGLNLSSLLGGKGAVYTNLSKKIVLNQKEAFGEQFIVSSKIDSINWKLTKETKNIGKYLCYKATTVEVIENNKGKHNKQVTAWYTTSINYPFGPSEYCGLPGLILELKVGKYNYEVTNINLNPEKEVIIKIPSKGKSITKAEYKDIGVGMSKKFDKK